MTNLMHQLCNLGCSPRDDQQKICPQLKMRTGRMYIAPAVLDFRGHAIAQPLAELERCLKLHNISEVEHVGVNFGFTDVGAVQFDVRVDVDPAQICTQGSAVLKLVIHANLNRKPKTVFQLKRAKGRFLLEEGRVVHTSADIGLERAIGREVVVERERGRQLLGGARETDTVDVDIMFKRRGSQKFDAQVVTDKILGCDGRADTVADISCATCQRTVSRFRDNRCDTETKGDIPLRLGRGGSRSKSSKGECDECGFHDSVSNRVNTIVLRLKGGCLIDVSQAADHDNRFDGVSLLAFRKKAIFGPECERNLPLSELASRNGGWPQIAVCAGCSTHWRIAHGRSGLILKTVFVAFPLVFIWTGIVSLILSKIPLFMVVKANGQEGLSFLSVFFIVPTFFLSYRRFLCRLPLKKAET